MLASQEHIRHAWFNNDLGMKRKTRANDPLDEEAETRKRQKRDIGLASEMANMRLTPPPAKDVHTDIEPMDIEPTIEEPTLNDVRMHHSSWYEPEPDRIVVTDLDGSSDEEDESPGIDISAALLKRLKPLASHLLPSSPSQALVLYRPLVKADEAKPDEVVEPEIEEPDDKMDVDMLD